MAYIELHQPVFGHRKTIIAAERLDIPEVHLVGHLSALWCWCLDSCQDGILPSSSRVIARGAQWTGDAKAFVDALVYAEFLDATEAGLAIHDWKEYGGKLIAKRRANAEKQARYRERQGEPTPTDGDVTVTSPPRNALEESREEESREELKINDSLSDAGDANDELDEPRKVTPPPPWVTGPAPENEAIRDRRHDVFVAYTEAFGIGADTGEWFLRRNKGWGHLSAEVLANLAPERMRAIATYCRERRSVDGYTHTPDVDVVLRSESDYDRWIASGSPPIEAKQPAANGRASPQLPTAMKRGEVPADGGLAEYRRRKGGT